MQALTKSQFTKLVVFPLGFLCLALALDAVLMSGLRRYGAGTLGVCNRMVAGQIHAQILVLGNSRAENSFDPRILHEVSGMKTFNLAWPGSGLELQLALLKTYLRHNREPQYLIQEVNVRSLQDEPKELFETGSLLRLISEPDLFQTLAGIDPTYVRHRYLPLSGLNDTRSVGLAVLGVLGKHRREELCEGFLPLCHEWSMELELFKRQHPDGISYGTDGTGRKTLSALLDLCRQKGIEVILVCTPEYHERQALVRNRVAVLEIIASLATQRQVQFWDYSSDPICRTTNWFWNSIHLNDRGATEFSKAFAMRLGEYMARSHQGIATQTAHSSLMDYEAGCLAAWPEDGPGSE